MPNEHAVRPANTRTLVVAAELVKEIDTLKAKMAHIERVVERLSHEQYDMRHKEGEA